MHDVNILKLHEILECSLNSHVPNDFFVEQFKHFSCWIESVEIQFAFSVRNNVWFGCYYFLFKAPKTFETDEFTNRKS